MCTAMRDKAVADTVRLLCDMGQMPTSSKVEEPGIKVSLEAKVARVVQLLTAQSNGMVLLHGMGGIGKTTLARAVFNQLHASNPTLPCCFLGLDPDTQVDKITKKQKQLLKDLAHIKPDTLNDVEVGRRMLAEKLRGRRVLLVVDNVWGDRLRFLLPVDIMQLLGGGSMVLVTSREQAAARQQGATEEEMECLPKKHAMELFCKYAFPEHATTPSSWEEHVSGSPWALQISAALDLCAGLPMALEVAGRYFAECKESGELPNSLQKAFRQQMAGRMEKEKSLFGALRLSWQILAPEEQEALLDIALILKGAPWDWVQHHCGASVLGRLCRLGLVKQQHDEWAYHGEYASAPKAQVAVHDTVSFLCADADEIGGPRQTQALRTSSEVRQACCPASEGERACVSGGEKGRRPAGMGTAYSSGSLRGVGQILAADRSLC
jgi:hypothetical protein